MRNKDSVWKAPTVPSTTINTDPCVWAYCCFNRQETSRRQGPRKGTGHTVDINTDWTELNWNELSLGQNVTYRYTCFGLRFIAFFTDWRFVATLHQASLLGPFFQEHLLISCLLCHVFVILAIFQTFSLLLYLWCDQWSLMLFCKKIATCWRLKWWLAFLAIKYVSLRYVHCFFRHNAIAHLVDYSIVST